MKVGISIKYVVLDKKPDIWPISRFSWIFQGGMKPMDSVLTSRDDGLPQG